MDMYIIVIILLIILLLIILYKPSLEKEIKLKPCIKKHIISRTVDKKEPKFENEPRIKFSNDVKINKSIKTSNELLSMYPEPKNEIPTDNPFKCKEKKALPYSNENIELLRY
jgi:hypothetical protein